jgi:hypothetical protein
LQLGSGHGHGAAGQTIGQAGLTQGHGAAQGQAFAQGNGVAQGQAQGHFSVIHGSVHPQEHGFEHPQEHEFEHPQPHAAND